jgi:hypothetical protein
MKHPSTADKRKTSEKFSYRILAIIAVLYARMSQMFLRVMAGMGDFVIGILESALNTNEKEALTLRLYNTASEKYAASQGLFAWEASWYAEVLPPAPGKILVTAAGRGREVQVLLKHGYLVHAAEPVAKFAVACADVPGIGNFFQADHDDIIQAVTTGKGPAAEMYGQTYDAVIIGWGGFNHIMDAEERQQLLNACHTLAPEGPVLLSFFAEGGQPKLEGRAFQLGRGMGRFLARLRGITPTADANDIFLWHAGFAHCFSEQEIESLAAALGRSATFTAEPYGHATLLTPAPQLNATVLRQLLKSYNL